MQDVLYILQKSYCINFFGEILKVHLSLTNISIERINKPLTSNIFLLLQFKKKLPYTLWDRQNVYTI
jgi:hypothetical protein